ncbi:hypothetical protein AB3N04_01115 (plasmid) [Alkalihalophilus sp. As8PL]|uniref:DUF4258 domain-containing protein n=1 Tax=Alkalihalophilus sp. As8PL TaxID=3237103 RepID=A0AB39BMV4_9BACI
MNKIMKEIHQCTLRVSKHAKEQMILRGYSNEDILSFFQSDMKLVDSNLGYNHRVGQKLPTYTIEGVDSDKKPMAIVLSREEKLFTLVTIMPTTDERRFRRLIQKRSVPV